MGKRGFASMSAAKRRAVASMGGKAAHQKGTAYKWTKEAARVAGRRGLVVRHGLVDEKKPD